MYGNTEEVRLQFGIAGKEAFRRIAAEETGTADENIYEFCAQLLKKENYHLTPQQKELLIGELATDILMFNPADLGDALKILDDKLSYIEVNTGKLAEGRNEFKQKYGELVTRIFDKIYGEVVYGEKGVGNLLLKEKKGESMRVYLLNPEYVIQNVGKEEVVARASMIMPIGDHTNFSANTIKKVDIRGTLRGLSRIGEDSSIARTYQGPF